ncbi:MAG TPA: hypothetical protein VK726_25715 [Acetobacteraceae bacterium]|nr:hypothetical protein [Acetobacteraceae bacterium]
MKSLAWIAAGTPNLVAMASASGVSANVTTVSVLAVPFVSATQLASRARIAAQNPLIARGIEAVWSASAPHTAALWGCPQDRWPQSHADQKRRQAWARDCQRR